MLRILLRFPWPRSYPRTKDIPWLMDQIRLDPDEVLWWKAKLRAKTKLQTLELIGKTDPKLTAMARLVKMFVDTHKLRAVVAMGTNERSRFEYRPRRRIVLGSDSLIQALHELGHAAYSKNIDLNLPYFLRDEAHIFATEAIAMMMDRMAHHPGWIATFSITSTSPSRTLYCFPPVLMTASIGNK